MLSNVIKGVGKPVTDMIVHRARDADAAWRGQRFEPRGDVDAVAKDVVVLDNDVAEIDPDTKQDTPIFGNLGVAIDHGALDLDGAAHRVHHAGKFRQQPVAGIFNGAAPMLLDLRIDELPEMRLEARVRSLLVRAHQARVAGDIGGEDRRKSALYAISTPVVHLR